MVDLKAVTFINEDIYRKAGEIGHCRKAVQSFIDVNHFQTIKLNPYQLHFHYTIPHALLFDLQQAKANIDYLVMYSNKDMHEFIYMYPAKWLLLKSYFSEVLCVEEMVH